MSEELTIGFIGLGNMGAPMSLRLIRAGYAVQVYDLDTERCDEAARAGATVGESARAVAQHADLLFTSLPRPDHVEALMVGDGVLAALREGSGWVDLTTNRIELMRELADSAPQGVSVADSPVTGAVDGARNGQLTLFLGGDAEIVSRAEPVLEHLGKVIRCGPLGSGNVVKLVTNQLWFVHAAALGEGFAMGMSHGVGLDVLWEAIKESVGDSFVARHDAPSIFAGHYDPSFTLDLCQKDLGLIGELASSVAAELPMTTAAAGAFDGASARYGSDAAELHVARRIEEDANLSFRLDGDWVPPWEG